MSKVLIATFLSLVAANTVTDLFGHIPEVPHQYRVEQK